MSLAYVSLQTRCSTGLVIHVLFGGCVASREDTFSTSFNPFPLSSANFQLSLSGLS